MYMYLIGLILIAFRYETLKGDSGGSDIGQFRFEENGLEKCMAKCDENRDCVGFGYKKPSSENPTYENCYIKSLVSYPADASIGTPAQNLRTGYRLRTYHTLSILYIPQVLKVMNTIAS